MNKVLFIVFGLIAISLAAPIYFDQTLKFLEKNPSELEKLTYQFSQRHNYAALRAESNGKELSESRKRGFHDNVDLPDAASYPLWYLNVNQTGVSRFVLGVPGARNVVNVALPWIPVQTIIRQSTKEWFTADVIAGQYTGPSYSLMWTRNVINGTLVAACLANRTAGFTNQQEAHATSYLQDGSFYMDVMVRNGRSNRWKADLRSVYEFSGHTNDFGGTSSGNMGFTGHFDTCDLTPYQFGFSQPQVTARTPYGTGYCEHNVGVVSGEYRFDLEGAGYFPVSQSASIIALVPPECRVGGSPTGPIDPLQLPDIDSAWCGN